jgi:hypothetical protein
MLPLGEIDGKPVFAGDKIEDIGPDGCTAGIAHPANRDFTSSRWPAPAKVYPVTQMLHMRMFDVYSVELRSRGFSTVSADSHGLAAVANAALRHAVDGDQVIPADEHKAAIGVTRNKWADQVAEMTKDRDARDMAVAEAMRNHIRDGWALSEHAACRKYCDSIDLAAIIHGIPQ